MNHTSTLGAIDAGDTEERRSPLAARGRWQRASQMSEVDP